MAITQGYGVGVDRATVIASGIESILGLDLLGYWDAARTDKLTLVSGGVSSWKDIKNNYDLIQTSATARPIYSATSFGGDPGLSFDGTDDFLHLTPHSFPINAVGSEIWCVCSQDALVADATVRHVVAMGTSSTTHRSLSRTTSGGLNLVRAGAGAVYSTLDGVDIAGRLVMRGVFDGANVWVEANGVADPSSAAVPTTSNVRMRVGAFINTSAGNFWLGQVAVILIVNPLTSEKAASLRAQLMSRRRL